MIRYISQKQLPLEGFDTAPGMILDPTNLWVKLRDCLPWDELSENYYKTLCSRLGRPAKDAGIVIGAVIIKHRYRPQMKRLLNRLEKIRTCSILLD